MLTGELDKFFSAAALFFIAFALEIEFTVDVVRLRIS